MEEACVGRATEGLHFQNVVRAPDVVRGPDVRFWSVEVCLRVPGLEASSRVSAHYASEFDDLVAFFRQLAADWRGWDGERTYESLEHDLRLTATPRWLCAAGGPALAGGWAVRLVGGCGDLAGAW